MTLFMTEICVADPEAVAAWYAGVLGLRVVLRDEPKGFVLLEATGGGRVALKRQRKDDRAGCPEGFRLVFQVDDLDAERRRLLVMGVEVDEPTENAEEQYREFRLVDPEGTPITVFAWSCPEEGH